MRCLSLTQKFLAEWLVKVVQEIYRNAQSYGNIVKLAAQLMLKWKSIEFYSCLQSVLVHKVLYALSRKDV